MHLGEDGFLATDQSRFHVGDNANKAPACEIRWGGQQGVRGQRPESCAAQGDSGGPIASDQASLADERALAVTSRNGLPRSWVAMVAFGLCVLTAPVAPAASAGPATATADVSVMLPFSPPLGKPIHLRSTKLVVIVSNGVEPPPRRGGLNHPRATSDGHCPALARNDTY